MAKKKAAKKSRTRSGNTSVVIDVTDDFNRNWLHSMRGPEWENLRKLRGEHNASKDHSYLDNKKGCKLCGDIGKAEQLWVSAQKKRM